ncbi:VOC family protein [Bacillus horti]|uniref:Catechol 2,3-dioxygenase n=1 Tax=Caldalkalibacillus horti TaxID=77523 RepID=A0ABT9W1G7_9BACI|nr:VOC family protein [Bacillus horti]MDQ0167095.1 catechol 2,3-dioxygenase [Bacillus horti]
MSFSIHPQTSIGYVHLRISSLERSVDFYTKKIGFSVLRQEQAENGNNMALLTVDGQTPLLILEELPDAAPKSRTTGLYHLAVLVPSRQALANWLFHFNEQEGRLEGASDHLFSEALYLSDPDHNGIEVYADRPREQWPKQDDGMLKGESLPLDIQQLWNEAERSSKNELPEGTTIGHIHLHVDHMKKAEDFYHGVLGFDVMIRMADHALFVAAGGYHHHIGLNTWVGVGAPPNPPHAVGLSVFSIQLQNKEEFDVIADRLKAANIKLDEQEAGLLVQDPAGNTIHFTY